MFNKTVFFAGDTVSNASIKVNAISGGIVKNHANSFFLRFNLKSLDAEALLSPSPARLRVKTWQEKEADRFGKDKHVKVPVEVLQLVIVGDMEVVAEVIDLPEENPNGK